MYLISYLVNGRLAVDLEEATNGTRDTHHAISDDLRRLFPTESRALSRGRKLFKLGRTQPHAVPKGLCEAVRMIFARFGVPEETSLMKGLHSLPRKRLICMHRGASNTGCLLLTFHSPIAELK